MGAGSEGQWRRRRHRRHGREGPEDCPHKLKGDQVGKHQHPDPADPPNQVAAEVLGGALLEAEPNIYRRLVARGPGNAVGLGALSRCGGGPPAGAAGSEVCWFGTVVAMARPGHRVHETILPSALKLVEFTTSATLPGTGFGARPASTSRW